MTARENADRGGSVLVTAETLDGGRDDGWGGILGAIPEGAAVLVVMNRRSAEEWVARWRRHAGRVPDDLRFVTLGETTRAAPARAAGSHDWGATPVRAVSRPADLTAVAMAVEDFLSARSADEPVVCFDSLTVLLQYVDRKRAFRFLHLVTDRVAGEGGTTYVHIDPTAHADGTVETLRVLFDSVVAPGE